jgi:G3E family GTPase
MRLGQRREKPSHWGAIARTWREDKGRPGETNGPFLSPREMNIMKAIRFQMVGGFLGAGKTTALARLAQLYIQRGERVALVTNDQALGLVDTHSLRSQGFSVGEVPGACFCCKFNDLVGVMGELEGAEMPDVILAEPVGSCTDLAATVIEPLRHLYADRFQLGPLAVLLKPEHGRKILRNEPWQGFSPKAAYIFLKQLEEADVIGLNKVDKLSDEQVAELRDLVERRFPEKTILALSALEGTGFPELMEALDREGRESFRPMDVDYDVYAEGEAELGWLNCQAHVTKLDGSSFLVDPLVCELAREVRAALARESAEPAHVKILAQLDGAAAVANLVGSEVEVELSLPSGAEGSEADLVVNARVAGAPEVLEPLVLQVLADVAARHELTHNVHGMQCFRPGRPVPTHRWTAGS